MLNSNGRTPTRHISFCHDRNLINALLFESDSPAELIWKLSDFLPGFVSEFKNSGHDSIYNNKRPLKDIAVIVNSLLSLLLQPEM